MLRAVYSSASQHGTFGVTIWLPILWMATGVCLFAGAHFMHAGHARDSVPLFRAFGILSLIVAVYLALGALLQIPTGGARLVLIERLHVAGACCVYAVGIWFIALFSRLRTWRGWSLAGAVLFGVLLVIDLMGPHSLLLENLHEQPPLILPWGEAINRYTGVSAPLAPAFYAAVLAVFCWAFWRCFALWRTGELRRAWPLAIYLVLQLVAAGYSIYATIHPLPDLASDALPFLALVVLLSRTLNLELRSYATALDNSNAALRAENGRREEAEDKLRDVAYRDAVSGLPNRHALVEWFAQHPSSRPRNRGALLIIDPQRFAIINHALGHRAGDQLLHEIGQRLAHAAGVASFVARLSGDELAVVLLPRDSARDFTETQALARAADIQRALAEPLRIEYHALSLNVHMGLVMFPATGGDINELLREGYAALHAAKTSGEYQPVLFVPAMQARLERELRLQMDLRTAIADRQLRLVYQPQTNIAGRLIGAEALLRWEHPTLGEISPQEFVGIAENSGQMPALGRLVMQMAFAMHAALPPAQRFRLSVNVSPWQLFLVDFLDTVQSAVRESGVNPNWITIEITETAFIHDIPDAVTKFHALAAMGIRLSIDDFGTGYASLALLKTFPVHELKIDQSFIHDMAVAAQDRFVAALIALADAMHVEVIAEGVETEPQRQALDRMGCHTFQGYLVGRPMPAPELLSHFPQSGGTPAAILS